VTAREWPAEVVEGVADVEMFGWVGLDVARSILDYIASDPAARAAVLAAVPGGVDRDAVAESVTGEAWAWLNRHDAPWSPSDATVNDLAFRVADALAPAAQPDRCPHCGHATHGDWCPNMASDSDCACTTSTPGREQNCVRCGGENVVWTTPSPLWNLIMRGNDINGESLFRDLVCMSCFIHLAEAAGVPIGQWRLMLTPEPPGLIKTTPSGRVWDERRWLWVTPEPETASRAVGDPDRCAHYCAGCHTDAAQRGEIGARSSALADNLRALVADWQATAGSRALGDPAAAAWQQAARQLLDALEGPRS
jgi:hypothetical protein